MKFTKKQIDRYSRQIILKKIGVSGQKKLLKSIVQENGFYKVKAEEKLKEF